MKKINMYFITVLLLGTLGLAGCGDKGSEKGSNAELKDKVENMKEEDFLEAETKNIDGKKVTERKFKDGTGGMVTSGEGGDFDEAKDVTTEGENKTIPTK